ncbi:radical SAM protein [Candidatus Woesearchaeota archaeon]|nr:radical SAM protein [Candidatus Woesearchaeota archaeon]
MGWKCSECGNTKSFVEINRVETLVSQKEATTKIEKIVNKFTKNPRLDVWCDNCKSKSVEWTDVSNQDENYIYEQESYVSENHNIGTIVFELTNKCDIDCVYCPKEGSEELDFNIIKRIIDENKTLQNPIRHFELGWDMGNPLSHSRIKEIMELFNQFDCNVNILTNGKNFVNNIKKLNLTDNFNFTFFLDHPDEKENDKLMGECTFSNTLDAFEYLNQRGISFNVYMRLNKYNYNKVEGMNQLVKNCGGGSLVPTEIYPLGKTKDDMLMDDEMKREAIEEITKLNLNKSIHFSPALLNENCTYQRKLRLFIDAKGRLSFCHFLSSLHNSSIGSIEGRSLLEIIQKNNQVRIGFLKNKNRLFAKWKKPRQTASPCSYCLHSFGLNKKW